MLVRLEDVNGCSNTWIMHDGFRLCVQVSSVVKLTFWDEETVVPLTIDHIIHVCTREYPPTPTSTPQSEMEPTDVHAIPEVPEVEQEQPEVPEVPALQEQPEVPEVPALQEPSSDLWKKRNVKRSKKTV